MTSRRHSKPARRSPPSVAGTGAVVRRAPGERRRILLAGVASRGAGYRHVVRADRPRVRHLRRHRGARRARTDNAIVGVVSASAPAYAQSFASGTSVSRDATTSIADGMACRTPGARRAGHHPRGRRPHRGGHRRRDRGGDAGFYADTHNVAEGAGAAGLAALLQERENARGAVAGIVLTGANVDPEPFARILSNLEPEPRRTRRTS